MKNDKNNKKMNLIFSIVIFAIILISILIIIVLFNRNYLNNIDFYLNGDEIIEIEKNSTWIDPKVNAYYNGDSILEKVIINDNVDIKTPGEYKVEYIIKKGLLKRKLVRKVIVTEIKDVLTLELKGDEEFYLRKGNEYIEPGFVAIFNGKDISNEVLVTGDVNINEDGEYLLKYSISKNSYNASKTRKVIVFSLNYKIELKDKQNYVKENTIIFSVNDDKYDYVILPNREKSTKMNISFPINSNGEYLFKIYDKYGGFVEEKIVIKNIDRELPTGSCIGYMHDSYTNIIVNANDDTGISGYEYIYGNNKSSLTKDNEYKYYENINSASVNIYDNLNNKTLVKCNMVDKSSIMAQSSYQSYTFIESTTGRKMKYWLYIPDNLTKRTFVPLMIYLHGDGSRGDNINLVNNYAYPKYIKNGEKYPFMMIAPQINYETNWTGEVTYKRLMNLINEIISNYNVDTKKIILAGGSSGGGGVYKIISAYPRFFSCGVIGSGIYDSAYRKFASNLIYTPMWVFHGTEDKNVYYPGVKSFAEYINTFSY